MARVAAGARLHFGFQNLSLAHERLYGSLGVGLDSPRVVVTADPAEDVRCDYDDVGRDLDAAHDRDDRPGSPPTDLLPFA